MATTKTKEDLLRASLKLISEKGYLGSTTREIAQEAGVTELTLFRHFGSKERLFEELLKTYTFLPELKELLPELDGLSGENALVVIATRFLSTLKERKSFIKILHTEVTIYPDKVREVYNHFIDEMRATMAFYLKSLQERGFLRKSISPEMAAKVFLWMLVSYFRSEEIMRPTGLKKAAMEQQVKDMIDIFLQGTAKKNGNPSSGRTK
jgi:AcrR family transcriptional regulator